MLALALAQGGAAQPLPIQDGQVMPLWSGRAPGALGNAEADIPALTVFLPRTMAPGTPAVVSAPAAATRALGVEPRRPAGRQLPQLASASPPSCCATGSGRRYHHPIELGDAQRAIRTLRSHAAEWRLDPARIGIMGFSAGGHLAMSASTHFDAGNRGRGRSGRSRRQPARLRGARLPGHLDDRRRGRTPGRAPTCSGEQPDPELARGLSGENAVTTDTPPTFLFQTTEDTVVPAENSVHYYLALRKAGVPAEMHVFEKGAHGVGLANDNPALSAWSALLANWLRLHGIVK